LDENTMTLLQEIEWEAPLIEPYHDPDAEALMRKKYGFVMDSVTPLVAPPLREVKYSS
jgi:hypothetical protein